MKRGISELIATVLIIGFTVALVAIIIIWGTRFVSEAQSDVDRSTTVGLACSKLNYDVLDLSCNGNRVNLIKVENKGDQDINGFYVRSSDSSGSSVLDQATNMDPIVLSSFEVADLNIDQSAANPTIVELIPLVNVENNLESCVSSIQKLENNDGFCDGSSDSCTGVDCNDNNDCTQDSCSNGVCSHTSLSSGTSCSGGVCDGSGNCVECLNNQDCNDTNTSTEDICLSDNTCVYNLDYTLFTTGNTWRAGTIGGVNGADQKCQQAAVNVGLTGIYKAWISYSSQSASSRLHHSTVPYKRVTGVIIADNWNDLTDGSLDNSPNVNESGASIIFIPGSVMITATCTTANGNPNPDSCGSDFWFCGSNWDSTLPSFRYGSITQVNLAWTENNFDVACTSSARLYCLEQPS